MIRRSWINSNAGTKYHLRELQSPLNGLCEAHFRSYHAQHFAFLGRALQQSIKICVQIEHEGFMCIQIMMPVGEGVELGAHSGILEFKVSSIARP